MIHYNRNYGKIASLSSKDRHKDMRHGHDEKSVVAIKPINVKLLVLSKAKTKSKT